MNYFRVVEQVSGEVHCSHEDHERMDCADLEKKEHIATTGLASLCRDADNETPNSGETRWSDADLLQLEKYVSDGADVTHLIPFRRERVLHHFIRDGNIEAVRIVMRNYKKNIDFTTRNYYESASPLHFCCERNISANGTRAMVSAIVDRLERNPSDIVDWGQLDKFGKDFLTYAAEEQKLSLVWGLVKQQPFFADALQPLRLKGRVWSWDWELLGEEESKHFVVGTGDRNNGPIGEVVQASRSTGRLAHMVDAGNCQRLLECIHEGADVFFPIPEHQNHFLRPRQVIPGEEEDVGEEELVMWKGEPIIYGFIQKGDVVALETCLETPHQINFTVPNSIGYNLLHYILVHKHPPDVVAGMLTAVLKRLRRRLSAAAPRERMDPHTGCAPVSLVLEGRGEEDEVDWKQETRSQAHPYDFVSLAAHLRYLSVVWNVFKSNRSEHVLLSSEGTVILQCEPHRHDWELISELERKIFQFGVKAQNEPLRGLDVP